MTEQYNYLETFTWTEATIKGKKRFFVEGYISTTDLDESNEVVTLKAQQDIVEQVRGRVITMDVEHEEWLDENGDVLNKPKNMKVPVAKIVEAELKDKGTWVKAEINQDSGSFKTIWNSIKNSFLHAFSIGFYPVEAVTKSINGNIVKFIDKINLINVTLTGSPVNTNATFRPVMKAVLKNMNGESNMVEDETVEETTEEETTETESEAKESPVEIVSTTDDVMANMMKEHKVLREQLEAQKAEIETLNAMKEKIETRETQHEADRTTILENIDKNIDGPLSTIKSLQGMVKAQGKQLADLKAFVKKPMMKSFIEKDNIVEFVDKTSPLDLIR